MVRMFTFLCSFLLLFIADSGLSEPILVERRDCSSAQANLQKQEVLPIPQKCEVIQYRQGNRLWSPAHWYYRSRFNDRIWIPGRWVSE